MAGRLSIGERSGSLVIEEKTHHDGWYWNYRVKCDCGVSFEIHSSGFRRKSCCPQCSQRRGAEKRTSHGQSNTPLHNAWKAMRNRCENPKNSVYKWYGAVGVVVCEEWQDFSAFAVWASAHGYEPGLTLDRIDDRGNYCPSNCEYVTRQENSRRMNANYKFVRIERSVSP